MLLSEEQEFRIYIERTQKLIDAGRDPRPAAREAVGRKNFRSGRARQAYVTQLVQAVTMTPKEARRCAREDEEYRDTVIAEDMEDMAREANEHVCPVD